MSLPSLDSLPPVPQETLQAMQAEADKKMAQIPPEQLLQRHPMLQDPLEYTETPDAIPEPVQAQPMVENQGENEQEMVENRTSPAKASAQESFKEIRERWLRAERERDELARKLQDVVQTRDTSSRLDEPEEDLSYKVEDDALVEGKHLSKVDKKIKKLEQQLQQYQQQSVLSATEIRLKTQYADFDSVVSADNIQVLRTQYPELAESINSNQDIYSKAVSAYTMIKKLGIAQVPDTYIQDKIQAQKNAAKPRPLASVAPQQGDSPLSRANAFANGLTPELQKQLLKEMNQFRNK